jgi:hypothetical protein
MGNLRWLFQGARPCRRHGRRLTVEALETRITPDVQVGPPGSPPPPSDGDATISQARDLGDLSVVRRVTNYALNPSSDIDLFGFEIVGGQQANISVSRPAGSNLSSYLRLFDANGNELANSGTAVGPDAALSYYSSSSGTLYVGISSQGNGSYNPVNGSGAVAGANTGAYVLTVNSPGAAQTNPANPNGEISTATDMGDASQPLQLTNQGIGPGGIMMYAFDAHPGLTVSFQVDSTSGPGFDSMLRLFDGNGNELAFSDDGQVPGKPFSRDPGFDYTFTQAGTYFLGLSGYPNYTYDPVSGSGTINGSAGTFQIELKPHALIPETSNVLSNAAWLGAATTLRVANNDFIASPIDVNMYRFTAKRGQTLTIAVGQHAGSNLSSYLRLFNSAGTELAHSGSGFDARLTYRFAITGTYFVGVSGQGNSAYNAVAGTGVTPSGTTGDYTLTLSTAASAPNDPHHDNRIDQAKNLGALSRSLHAINKLSTSTDVNMVSFTVTAGQRVGIAAHLLRGSRLTGYLRLFDGNGNELANSGLTGRTRAGASLVYTFVVGGTYYLGISSFGNNAYVATTGAGMVRGQRIGGYNLTIAASRSHASATLVHAARRSAASGMIAGLVYYDQYGDGVYRARDVGLASHLVYLDLNGNGVRNQGEPAVITNGQGGFLFSGLRPGTRATVSVPLSQLGYQIEKLTSPSTGFYSINLRAGQKVTNLHFGMGRYLG